MKYVRISEKMKKTPLKLVVASNEKNVVNYFTPAPADQVKTAVPVRALSKSGQLVLWSIRRWVQRRRLGDSVDTTLKNTYTLAGIPEAQKSFEELMTLLATVALRHVVVECQCSAFLSSDELLIMHTLRSLQSGHREIAERRIARLMMGQLGWTFCRIGADYVKFLGKSGFSLNQISVLSVAR
jgi:hypothetical protein